MKRVAGYVTVVATLITVVGCGQFSAPSSSSGGIAVVDLDAVAKALGRAPERDLNELLQTREAALNQGLAQLRSKFGGQVQKKRQEVTAESPAEEKQKLAKMEQDAAQLLTVAQRRAQTNLNSYAQQLRGELGQLAIQIRDEVRPVAQKIAKDKGLLIVVPKNEGILLSIDPAVDITQDVILAMRGSKAPAMATSKTTEAKPTSAEVTRPARITANEDPASAPAAPAEMDDAAPLNEAVEE